MMGKKGEKERGSEGKNGIEKTFFLLCDGKTRKKQ